MTTSTTSSTGSHRRSPGPAATPATRSGGRLALALALGAAFWLVPAARAQDPEDDFITCLALGGGSPEALESCFMQYRVAIGVLGRQDCRRSCREFRRRFLGACRAGDVGRVPCAVAARYLRRSCRRFCRGEVCKSDCYLDRITDLVRCEDLDGRAKRRCRREARRDFRRCRRGCR